MYIRSDVTNTMPNVQSTTTQTSWDPSTISNLIFGIFMVLVGIIAIWQGRHGRVVALDGALAIIGPLHRFRSPLHLPDIEFEGLPHHVITETANASPLTAQLAIANRECNSNGILIGGDSVSIPVVSSRVTTLSSIEYVDKSAQCTKALTAELDITEVEGCEHVKDAVGHQRINLDAVP